MINFLSYPFTRQMQRVDDSRIILKSQEATPGGRSTDMTVRVFDFARVARIAVSCPGFYFADLIAREEEALIKKGMHVIQVWIGLSHPWCGEAVDVLRKKGYFLGGIFPRWFDEDAILMQRILGRPNWDGIHLYSERAKEIYRFIYDDWKKMTATKGEFNE